MDAIHLGPTHRHHLSSSIELHGAGAERDHGAIERDVFGFEAMQVAHHLRLAVIGRENGMREIGRLALKKG